MSSIEVVMEPISTDLDAFDIYTLFKDEKNTIFLDGGKDFESSGRYSFIGVNAFLTIKEKHGVININGKEEKGDIFNKLKEIMSKYKIKNNTQFPFIAGGIGYMSYDLGREIEDIPSIAVEDINIPNLYYNFYDNIIIVDNLNKEVFITALGIHKDKKKSIDEIKQKIWLGEKVIYKKVNNHIEFNRFKSNFHKEEYIETVDRVREYIRSGDIYIMNLTQRFWCNTNRSPYDVYRDLRYINPAPFAAYMNLDKFSILSSSPERFLKIKDNIVETRPIKGTRPRGENHEEDIMYSQELVNSEKDKSELLMIVDLERNDLSRVCKPFTVKVPELFKLETYPTVFHLVSTVVGKIKDQYNCIDCIRACFPGGSITGAPKIRSMEIIEELEKVRRNIYTGAIGYISFDGNVDSNIVIRTIHMQHSKAYFGVGGGITWESDCSFEYEETLHKAAALMRALCNEDDNYDS